MGEFEVAIGVPVRLDIRDHLLTGAVPALVGLHAVDTFDPPQVGKVLVAVAPAHAFGDALDIG
jgi:hypothetical protein